MLKWRTIPLRKKDVIGQGKAEREPGTIWLTGLPCSGKTTLAAALKEELDKRGYKTVHLDGDVVRAGINLGGRVCQDQFLS